MIAGEGRTTMQSAAGATGNGTALSVIGYGAAVLQITGTFAGTVTFEASVNESDFVAIRAVNMGTGGLSTTATAPGLYYIAAAALRLVRARVSAWTSGTITVVGGVVALGNNVPGTGVYLIDDTGANIDLVHTSGVLHTIAMPYEQAIAESLVTGRTSVRRFGNNEAVSTSLQTLSHIGALMYYPSSAETLKIKSDDVDDDGAPVGTGARTLYLEGLDGDYAAINDTITLNGTTAVDSNVDFLRVFTARVLTVGSSGWNEGVITVYGADGTSKILAIAATDNESHSATYTVPAGQTLSVGYVVMAEASNKGSSLDLYVRPFGGIFYNKREFGLLQSSLPLDVKGPMQVTEKSDVEMRVKGILADAVASGGFMGWVRDN